MSSVTNSDDENMQRLITSQYRCSKMATFSCYCGIDNDDENKQRIVVVLYNEKYVNLMK